MDAPFRPMITFKTVAECIDWYVENTDMTREVATTFVKETAAAFEEFDKPAYETLELGFKALTAKPNWLLGIVGGIVGILGIIGLGGLLVLKYQPEFYIPVLKYLFDSKKE